MINNPLRTSAEIHQDRTAECKTISTYSHPDTMDVPVSEHLYSFNGRGVFPVWRVASGLYRWGGSRRENKLDEIKVFHTAAEAVAAFRAEKNS